MDGRTLPTRGSLKTLGPGSHIVNYSLRLLEVLEVILEPTMDELQKDAYEQTLKDIISCDPAVQPGPKKYPNEYLSRILLDNYLHLLKLSSLYFNLSLSSLVTRYLVNIVYALECWEIYHLLHSIPHLDYFLNLIGFEITLTPFGHVVKPPENYLGFNLRQGLQYSFPFPFYNYSYHSTRPEARLEKYKRVEIKPYLDIRLNKGKRGRGRPKAQRFTSAVAERILEGGYILPISAESSKADSDVDDYDHWEEWVLPFKEMSPRKIYDDFERLYTDGETDDDVNATDGDEHLEKLKDYFSDEEDRKSAMAHRKYKYVHSRYTKKLSRKRQPAKRKSKADHSKSKLGSLEGGIPPNKVASGSEHHTTTGQTLPVMYGQKDVPIQISGTKAKQQGEGAGFSYSQDIYVNLKRDDDPIGKTSRGSQEKSTLSNKARTLAPQANTEQIPVSSRLTHGSRQRSGSYLSSHDSKLLDNESVAHQTSHKRDVSTHSVELTKSSGPKPLHQSQTQTQTSTPQTKIETPSSMSPLAPAMVAAQSSVDISRRTSQYAVSGYPAQFPMRAREHETQGVHAPTGQPVAQIVTLPTYQYAAFNPYSAWIPPQAHAIDKLQESKHSAEQQSLIMAAYQKYGYPEAYNPYIAGYPSAYPAPMYQRPDQIYYTQGAPNIAYATPGTSTAYTPQYPYVGTMYAPQYPQQQMHSPPTVGKGMTPLQPQKQKRKSLSGSSSALKKMSTKDKMVLKKGGLGDREGPV